MNADHQNFERLQPLRNRWQKQHSITAPDDANRAWRAFFCARAPANSKLTSGRSKSILLPKPSAVLLASRWFRAKPAAPSTLLPRFRAAGPTGRGLEEHTSELH